MNRLLKHTFALAAVAIASHAAAQVTFYQDDDFRGPSFTTDRDIGNFQRFGFNDRASSVVVQNERWEVCQDVRFEGRCIVLRPGRYPSLSAMGLNDRVSSVRAIGQDERIVDGRYAPAPWIRDRGDRPAQSNRPSQITFFEHDNFEGRGFTADQAIEDFGRIGFNDRASSIEVRGENWVVCEDIRYAGRCLILQPGRYPSLSAVGMNDRISSVREMDRNDRNADYRVVPGSTAPGSFVSGPGRDLSPPAEGRITFYEHDGFQGQTFTADRAIPDFSTYSFNDRASSIDVVGRWVVCEDARFSGRCIVLQPGRYPSLSPFGLNDRISSVRPADRNDLAQDVRQAPVAAYDYRRRGGETLYEAQVTSVRAVVAGPQQRCWVERNQIASNNSSANVPGAIAGALIGGILGHQVGGGSGRDAATALGVIGGAAIGANVGTGNQPAYTQDVQRCDRPVAGVRPDYWDVSYVFRGQEYRVQMAAPPGPTVTVNGAGEPRA
ncbi:MAG: beta/gamma crystallin-related protein [Ramlibacter sp.]